MTVHFVKMTGVRKKLSHHFLILDSHRKKMITQFFPMTVHSFKWRPHFLKMACPFKTLTASFKKSARCCLNPNCSFFRLCRSFLGKVSLNSASFRTVSGGKAQLTAEPVYLILLMLPSFFARAAAKQILSSVLLARRHRCRSCTFLCSLNGGQHLASFLWNAVRRCGILPAIMPNLYQISSFVLSFQ